MAKSTFVSFHYQRDHARVQQVLNMGAIEGQQIVSAQTWESVKRKGRKAIEAWIDGQMKYKRAVVVLVGKETASREWVDYEIRKAWNEKRPLVGIRIHGLKDLRGETDTAGANPFTSVKLQDGQSLNRYVVLHNPSGRNSKQIYDSIKANIGAWVANASSRS
jgi:hypothetical protein